jgi:predicted AAA+ superfamily ATPase
MDTVKIVSWYEKQVLKMSLNEFVRKGKQIYLFFDEVQNLNSWAQELKNIIDHVSEGGLKVLATGSSSLRIKRDQYALAGRSKQIDLGPLRLREIIGIRDLGVLPCVKDKNILENWTDRNFWLDLLNYGEKHSKLIEKSFEYYSRLGGFPYCHNKNIIVEDESELAKWMVDSVIDRTIFYDLPVNSTGRSLNKEVLSQTFKQICRHTGQSLSIEKLRSEIFDLYQSEITQKDIIQALQYFEDSMLMCKIAPLEIGARRQRHGYKLCLCDHFLRQANLQEKIPISPSSLINVNEVVSTMAGHIIEGLIGYALHSIPAMDIAWFPERRNEPELDFVLTMGLKGLPIEVKYKRNRPKNGDLAGLRSFCCQKKYNAEFGLLITQEYTGPIGDNVIAIPASTFLSIL